jgi:hypothetical protein
MNPAGNINASSAERWTPRGSSMITEVEYDYRLLVLSVVFHNGTKYEYLGVPAETYRGWTKAESAGRFFHEQIKGRYETFRDPRTSR